MSTSVEPGRRSPRTGTVVWGLIAVVIGLAFMTVQLTDLEFDPVVVLLVILLSAGLILVIAGLMSATRARSRESDDQGVTSTQKEGTL